MNGDVALAYQVFGEGPVDLLYIQGYCSQLDMSWESPYLARFLRGLGARARVIATDRRGWGLSERFSPGVVPPLEVLAEDLSVVMDAAGSSRAVVFASWDCGPFAMLFAAAHPERAAALVLCDALPVLVQTEDTPMMPTKADWRAFLDERRQDWGTGFSARDLRDDREREWITRYERATVARGAFLEEGWRLAELDARAVLPSIRVPTLVVGFEESEDGFADPAIARFTAGRIPDARLFLVGVDGDEHDVGWFHWYGRGDAILREISVVISEIRDLEVSYDRVLSTVLFTDIVGSTAKASELGDAGWKDLVARHHQTVRQVLGRYRGREIDTAGDGFFATFDGPARAVRCAQAIEAAVQPLGLEVRAGVHTGEIELAGDAVRGIAVHIGARVGALAGPSEVLVSQTVKDLVVGSGLEFEDAGEHELKGLPDRWHLYRVVG